MIPRVFRALCVLVMAVACGCSLDAGGLLDEDAEAGDEVPVSDGAGDTETTPAWEATALDESSADAVEERTDVVATEGGGDALGDAMGDATVDAHADAQPPDSAGEGGALDAASERAIDADAIADAPADTSRDGLTDSGAEGPEGSDADGGDAGADGPGSGANDGGAMPIVWDGGALVDPQFDDADWISFCTALASCGSVPSVSGCMALLKQPASADALIPPPDMVSNVNGAAPTCRAVRKALGGGSACPSSTVDFCRANSLVTCRYGFTMTVDCTTLGMVCSQGNANAGCGFGDCAASQEGQTFCVGDTYLAQCTAGRFVPALDCQTWDATCVGPDGSAHCQGAGAIMCTTGASCIGTSVVDCFGGLLGSVDCSNAYDSSFSCFTDSTSKPVCASGTDCDPTTYTDTCDAMDQLTFCNAGTANTYDCTASYNHCDAGHCTL